MLDILIKNGTVINAHSTEVADVGIVGEKVVSITAPGVVTEAKKIIDAKDKYVIPGGIDPHVHFNFGFPPVKTQPYQQGSIAAAYGGTTTLIDFAMADNMSLLKAVESKLGEMEGNMAVDYSVHCILSGKVTHKEISEIKKVIDMGIPSFKMFMIYFNWFPGDGPLLGMFQELAKHGGMGIVHAENTSIHDYQTEVLIAKGKTHGKYAEYSRTAICEEEATRRALFLAERAGSPLYIFHMTAKESIDALRESRAKGLPMYGETCHNYLVYTNDDVMNRPDGLKYINFPPARYEQDRQTLWKAVNDNVLVVSTDDFSVNAENREQMGDVLPEPEGGHAGLETRLPVVYTEGVAKGRISINRFVEATSTRIAKIFGLYPNKGLVAVGSDADIVVFDPNVEKKIRVEDLHTVNYSIWDGYTVKGMPTVTISRGSILVENGIYTGRVSHGKFVRRSIGNEVITRPI